MTTTTPAPALGRPARRSATPLAAKVPEITALFWVVKVITTGMGEAASDWLGETSLVLGGLVGVGGFALTMWLQLRAPRYRAPVYWSAVGMLAVSGTIAADVVHVAGLSYWVTTALYAGAVALLFVLWRRSEGTLSIHSITTRRRELFYWATVLATFALGTAAGDLTALRLHWGFLASGMLFLAAIAVPLVAWRLGLNATVAFWSAYVLTRPLGASLADWVAKPPSRGSGLGHGDLTVTLVSLGLLVVLVGWLAVTRQDIQTPAPDPAARTA